MSQESSGRKKNVGMEDCPHFSGRHIFSQQVFTYVTAPATPLSHFTLQRLFRNYLFYMLK